MKTEQDWENYHKEADQKLVKRIKKCNLGSTIYMILGILSFTWGGSMIPRIMVNIAEMGKVKGHLTFDEIMTFQNRMYLILFVVLLLLCVFFFFKAMFRWDEGERLSASRFHWTPDEEEIEFINKRFDNPFAAYMLSALSPTDTRILEVGFRAITVHSNRGTASCYYSKHGYEQLTNYGTKQLAYYLASKAFTGGFVIYQTKVVPAGSDRYINGVTDIGGIRPPKQTKSKRFKRMLIWLAIWLQDFLRVKTDLKIPREKTGLSPVVNGQIVVNKGYAPKSEGLKPL